MFLMKDNKIIPAQVKVSSSPSYTLADLRVLAHDFLQTTDSGLGTEGMTMRLKLSIFLAWLAKVEKEREGNDAG